MEKSGNSINGVENELVIESRLDGELLNSLDALISSRPMSADLKKKTKGLF